MVLSVVISLGLLYNNQKHLKIMLQHQATSVVGSGKKLMKGKMSIYV